MIPYRTFVPLIALVATACLKLPEIGSFPEDSGTPDTAQPQPDAGSPGGTLSSVRLLKPTGTVFTNGTLDVQVELVGSPNVLVELVLDGKDTVAVLEPPAYKLAWNTASIQEGPHLLTARAVLGSKTLVSEARTVTVDRTPPQFVLRTPAPDAQEVSVHEPIYAVFSEAIKTETLTDSSVRLTLAGGATVPRTISLSSDGKTLRVLPNSSPSVPSTLMLNVTNAITDMAGNNLSLPANSWTWTLPAWITHAIGPGPSTDFSVTHYIQDAQGNSVFALIGPDAEIFAVHRDSNGNWQSLNDDPQLPPIALPSDGYNANIALQLDSSRTPVLAYNDGGTRSMGKAIHIQRWQDNLWKTLARPLPEDTSEYQFAHLAALELNKADMPVVAWIGSTGYNYLLVHRWTGTTWEAFGSSVTVDGDTDGDHHLSPSLQLDASGVPVIAWSAYDGRIYVARWDVGSRVWRNYGQGLSAYPQLSTRALDPSLRLDGAGNPIVAWRQADSTGTTHIHVRAWLNGSWQDRGTALSAAPGTTAASEPELYSTPSNSLVLVWAENVGGIAQTHFRLWTGTQWEPLIAPLSGGPFAISFDAQDTPMAAKGISDASGDRILIYTPNR
jgi:hypothetical protein